METCENYSVLIISSNKTGGVSTFARNLAVEFKNIGIEANVIRISDLFSKFFVYRSSKYIKILSLQSIFLSPFLKNTISVIHGIPRIDSQGLIKFIILYLSFIIAQKYSKLVAVSDYVSVHMAGIFNLKIRAVIHNPVNNMLLNNDCNNSANNNIKYITYVGRIDKIKNVDKILQCACIHQDPNIIFNIVGDGPELESYKDFYRSPNIIFHGSVQQKRVYELLSRSTVMVSLCDMEGFGLSYLEALSCGCNIVMPTTGAGIEIDPNLINNKIFLVRPPYNEYSLYKAIVLAIQNMPVVRCKIIQKFGSVASRYIELANEA